MVKKKEKTVVEADVPEHPAVIAWQEIQAIIYEPNKLEILKEKENSSVYRISNTRLNLSPVIAKRCKTEKALNERIIYEEIFPSLSLETPKYYGYLKEVDGIFSWLFIEDVGNQQISPLIPKHRALAAHWIGEMNIYAKNTHSKSQLPIRGPKYYQYYLLSSRKTILNLIHFHLLDIKHQELLTQILSMCDYLEEHWNKIENYCNQVPHTLVHGDCLVKNAHVWSPNNKLTFVPFDWASAGWGLPASDIGQLGLPYKKLPPTIPDYKTYLKVVQHTWPNFDLGIVKQLANLGQLFWSLKVICLSLPELDDPKTYLEGLMNNINVYASVLDTTIQTADWIN